MGGLFYFLFHLPLSPYFSFSTSLTTRHSVFGTAALIFLRGRQRILKATITAQNYQFPLPLTLWEEGTRERNERAEKGMRDSNLGWREHPPPPEPQPTPHPPPGVQSCAWAERITPRDELDLTIGGQTSYYTARVPLSSLPANRPGHCSTNADLC